MSNPEQVLTIIKRLLSPFPVGNVQGTAEDVLRRYIEAVRDHSADDIEAGRLLVVQGKLPGYDGRFAPTPPQFATACRHAMDARLRAVQLTRIGHPLLPPPDIQTSPEQRARAKARVAEFVASVSDDPADEATIAVRNARWAKVNARFAPPMDDHSVMERLLQEAFTRHCVRGIRAR